METKEEAHKLGERMKADLRELRRLGKLPATHMTDWLQYFYGSKWVGRMWEWKL